MTGVDARDAVLRVTDVVKQYGVGTAAQRALNGVTLEIERGSFLAIMGPSGSGKSTLLHLLGGLDRPTSGQVVLDGQRLDSLDDTKLTELRRSRLGFVFQFFNLVPVLTAAENVALPAVIAGQRPDQFRDRVQRALADVELVGKGDRLPAQLSGGEQQRVAIARALLPQPAVLLADEPTGNLDSQTGLRILELLRAANRTSGQTVVLVTHDPGAAAFADEVIVLSDGQIAGELLLGAGSSGTGDDREQRRQEILRWLERVDRRAPAVEVDLEVIEPPAKGRRSRRERTGA